MATIVLMDWRADKSVSKRLLGRLGDYSDPSVIGFYDRAVGGWKTHRQQDFLRRAAVVTQRLIAADVQSGQRVIVACTSPEAVLLAFVGSSMGGAVPTILPIRTAFDSRDTIAERIHEAWSMLGPDTVVIAEEKNGKSTVPTIDFATVLTLEASTIVAPLEIALPQTPIGDISHVQLTSGSTGEPKGVVVTHENVFSNIWSLMERGQGNRYDVCVSWLPLYHDMGLISQAMLPLLLGSDLYLMSPFDYLSDPVAWIQAISDKKATVAASPNFGYELVAQKISNDQLAALDLTAWRVACCGAEPISASAVRSFYERFAAAGLSNSVFTPCYGLAEATLAVTFVDGRDTWRSISVTRTSLARLGDLELVAPGGDDAVELVALGSAIKGLTVALIDETGAIIDSELRCGEVVVSGPSVSPGWLLPDGNVLPFADDGLHTGDIGFFQGGDLFVVERIKNIIIRNGQNYSSQVLEETLANLAGVDVTDVLVLDRDIAGGSGLTGIVEIDKRTAPRVYYEAVLRGIDQFHPALESLVFVKRGALPRTTSGKKRQVAVREALNAETLPVLFEHEVVSAQVPWAIGTSEVQAAIDGLSTIRLDDAGERRMLAVVADHVRSRGLDIPVTMAARLEHDLNMDSLELLNLAMHVQEEFGVEFTRDVVAEVKTVGDLMEAVSSLGGSTSASTATEHAAKR